MKVFNSYGSKDRLYEIMKRIDENFLPIEEKNKITTDFIEYCFNFLEINGEEEPRIVISYDKKEAANQRSFGKYTPEIQEIRVVATNRNLADTLRTLAHELVHYKQDIDGRIEWNSNNDGSDIENEANAKAAVIMRKFGKQYPNIFE